MLGKWRVSLPLIKVFLYLVGMKNAIQNIHPIFFLIIATTLEVSGDAIIRKTIYEHTGMVRIGFGLIGALLLFGYGLFLNLAPVEFGKVVGLYIATLFVVWQIITYITFKTLPTVPVIVGGLLVVAGGLIITFWKR
jgi:small multidrug resistance family-3 protein